MPATAGRRGAGGRRLRILLSDGSGLTSRQVAPALADAGHEVEVLSPDPLALTRFTRSVRRVLSVPPYGDDPFRWLDAALEHYRTGRFDVLFPTQEQVAVLARSSERLHREGVATAVPTFESLVRVQDKVTARATLLEVGVPQPESAVVSSAADLGDWDRFPVFVKLPIGTASFGVERVEDATGLRRLGRTWDQGGWFADGGVVLQVPVDGPLLMVQSVFDHGAMVASHANLRVREGAQGGASHKRSVDLPDVRGHVEALGAHLAWHGALSMDAILGADGPVVIDVNPRLVEPANARRAGVDLTGALLDLATGRSPAVQPPGRPGVATHQGLLAVLGAARRDRPRRAVLSEVAAMAGHRGDYRDSAEELTPLAHDWRSGIPGALATTATLVHPPSWRWFASNATANYALSPEGWRLLRGTPAA